jgi:hypothetical protein
MIPIALGEQPRRSFQCPFVLTCVLALAFPLSGSDQIRTIRKPMEFDGGIVFKDGLPRLKGTIRNTSGLDFSIISIFLKWNCQGIGGGEGKVSFAFVLRDGGLKTFDEQILTVGNSEPCSYTHIVSLDATASKLEADFAAGMREADRLRRLEEGKVAKEKELREAEHQKYLAQFSIVKNGADAIFIGEDRKCSEEKENRRTRFLQMWVR